MATEIVSYLVITKLQWLLLYMGHFAHVQMYLQNNF